MLAAPNTFEIVAGAITVTDAVEVFPAPACVEVTVTLLFFNPAVVPVTLTDTTQLELLGTVPPARLTIELPPVAVAVPPQVLLRLGVADTTSPEGRLSVNAIPLREKGFAAGLLIVKDKVVEPFSAILVGANAFVIIGGVATVRLAIAVLPVPPFVEVTFPVVFVN